MNGPGFLLLIVAVAVLGTVGVLFLLYKRDLDCARVAAERGGLVADTDAGPIEYAEKGSGTPLLCRVVQTTRCGGQPSSQGESAPYPGTNPWAVPKLFSASRSPGMIRVQEVSSSRSPGD